MPAGENPPPGGDPRLLPRAPTRRGPVNDRDPRRAGKVVRTLLERRSGAQPRSRHSIPVAYDKLCQRESDGARLRPAALLAGAADGGLDEGRHAPRELGPALPAARRRAAGAAAAVRVPHRTYPSVERAVGAARHLHRPPDGRTARRYTQPLTLHLDPRVKTPALALLDAHFADARDVQRRRKRATRRNRRARSPRSWRAWTTPEAAKMKTALTALAPPAPAGGRGRRTRFRRHPAAAAARAPNRPATLDSVSAAMLAAAMAMQEAEAAPTAREIAAVTDARRQSTALMARWTNSTTVDLAGAEREAQGRRSARDRAAEETLARTTSREPDQRFARATRVVLRHHADAHSAADGRVDHWRPGIEVPADARVRAQRSVPPGDRSPRPRRRSRSTASRNPSWTIAADSWSRSSCGCCP